MSRTSAAPMAPPPSRRQRMRELEKHPLVQEAITLFDGEVIRVDEPRLRTPSPEN